MRVSAQLRRGGRWWTSPDTPAARQLKAEGATPHDEVLVGVSALSNPAIWRRQDRRRHRAILKRRAALPQRLHVHSLSTLLPAGAASWPVRLF